MPTIDPSQYENLRLDGRTGRLAVCEYLKVTWDTGVVNYYGAAAWQDEAPFTSVGVDIEPRLMTKNGKDPFHELELSPDLRTESIKVVFSDIDRAIRTLFQTYGSGVLCEFYLYYPDYGTTKIWSGQLQAPQVYGWKTTEAIVTNGNRSREQLIPSRVRMPKICTFHHFGGELPDADAIASNGCDYDRHIGGSRGNFKTGSTPYTFCPKDFAACTARGMTDRWGGFDMQAADIISDPNKGGYLAKTKGNGANTEPVRLVFGTKKVRANNVLLYRAALTQKDPKKSWMHVLFDVCEGPVTNVWNVKVNGKIATPENLMVRLGAKGQPPTNWSPGVSNFSSTVHCYVEHGWVDFTDGVYMTADDVSDSECEVQGFSEVCVYTGPTTKTRIFSNDRVWILLELYRNTKFGMGYAETEFTIADWITAAAWGNETVSHTATFPDGETRTYTSRRTKFDAILEGRPAAEQIEDICLGGAISVPFQHNGTLTVSSFRKATSTELTNARVFTDVGDDVNIVWGEAPMIELSQVPDNKVVNEVEIRFEDAANGHAERPLTFKDPDQQVKAGKILGPGRLHRVPKKYTAFGITEEAEAVRFGNRLLKLGPHEEGGTHNNLRVKITVPFEQVLGLRRYEIIKIVSELLTGFESPTGVQFEYFRVLSIKKGALGRAEITGQAYNAAAYDATEGIYNPIGTPLSTALVAGAGYSPIDGAYKYVGDVNGKPSYKAELNELFWNGSAWSISNWYYGTSATAYPWETTYTSAAVEYEPAPVVIQAFDYSGNPVATQPEQITITPGTYDEATGLLPVTIN